MQKKILNVLSILLGLLMINGGLSKFFNYMPTPDTIPEAMVKDFAALQEIVWLMPLIGIAELVGGVLVLFSRTRAVGALVLFPVMVGILLTNTLVDSTGLIIAVVVWAILLWILYDNKEKYLVLLSK